MWMINPKVLCRQHLLGEHNELHKHKWTFEKKHRKDNYIKKDRIEPKSMKIRHEQLVSEMKRRGYNHKSPFEAPDISYLPKEYQEHEVNRISNVLELYCKCEECRKRMNNWEVIKNEKV